MKRVIFTFMLFLAALSSGGSTPEVVPPSPSFYVISCRDFTSDIEANAILGGVIRREIGTVQKLNDGKQALIVNGKTILNGFNLSPASESSNGTIAVSAYPSARNQIDGDGSDMVIDSKTGCNTETISSVWLIDASGARHKVTSDQMHATYPLISPDGRWLAFAGVRLDDKRIPGLQQVYIVALNGCIPSPPVSLKLPSLGVFAPIKWEKNQLIITTTSAEGSSDFRLTWIKILPQK